MRSPLASVIIPLYNKEEYVAKSIESALGQRYENKEIIVVNDGSTDRSLQVAKSYEPFTKILSISNRGIAGARNAGVLISRGEVILPLDADDWIDPEYLSKTIPLMTEGVGLVSTDMQRFGLQDQLLPAKIKTAKQALEYNEIPVCSLIRREAFLQTGGYVSKIDGYADWNMWVEILKRGWKMATVNEPLFHYRVLGNAANYEADLRREEFTNIIRGFHQELVE